jgi:hypothetical protein
MRNLQALNVMFVMSVGKQITRIVWLADSHLLPDPDHVARGGHSAAIVARACLCWYRVLIAVFHISLVVLMQVRAAKATL